MDKTELIKRARTLRRDQTDAERLLWGHLRDRRLDGLKFRRQAPRAPYIVDFVCAERGIAVELDGSQHGDHAVLSYDVRRTRILEKNDLRVLRFWNSDVLDNLHGVLELIRTEAERQPPGPS